MISVYKLLETQYRDSSSNWSRQVTAGSNKIRKSSFASSIVKLTWRRSHLGRNYYSKMLPLCCPPAGVSLCVKRDPCDSSMGRVAPIKRPSWPELRIIHFCHFIAFSCYVKEADSALWLYGVSQWVVSNGIEIRWDLAANLLMRSSLLWLASNNVLVEWKNFLAPNSGEL